MALRLAAPVVNCVAVLLVLVLVLLVLLLVLPRTSAARSLQGGKDKGGGKLHKAKNEKKCPLSSVVVRCRPLRVCIIQHARP